MTSPLAIVIPAFKPDFLRETLTSLAAQTANGFRLYVGNDGGPEEIGNICADFPGLSIDYHRFDNNLGATSLVQQWNRCVRRSTERWVWLLSDDDVVSPECVDTLLNHLELVDDRTDLLRFNTETIDAAGRFVRDHRAHPPTESGEDFVFERLAGRRESFVVEYVFRREAFDREGGFVDFPVAWCSDDASWFAFAGHRPIVCLPDGKVSWRASGLNITDQNERRQAEKLEAAFAFLDFVSERVRTSSAREATTWEAVERAWLEGQIRHVMPLPTRVLHDLVDRLGREWTDPQERIGSRLAAWNSVAILKSMRGRLRQALRSL